MTDETESKAEPGARRSPSASTPKQGGSKGAVDRVSQVHAQARPTFVIAGCFAIVAAITAVLPHDTGIWLPLHLLLVGTVLGSIVAATQLLAVTWSSSPAPANWLADVQRVSLFAGVVAVAVGRELSDSSQSLGRALLGIGGTAVIVALALLIVSLVQIRKGAVTDRYEPAILGYILASSFGIIGVGLGAALGSGAFASDHEAVRGVHMTVNALGLVGIVIASTLPFFLATQARMKMSPSASPMRIKAMVATLGVSTVISLTGWVCQIEPLSAAGAWLYAATLVAGVFVFPRIGRKQLDWAGPRLVQLASGYLWWVVALALMGANALWDTINLETALVLMTLGGFAQIVSASLMYFAPVILSGKRKPGDGLKITKSWIVVVSGNLAAIGVVARIDPLTIAAVIIWMADLIYRLARLLQFARRTNAEAAA